MSEPSARVLVVDDDQAACNLLSKILKSEGHSPIIASGGPEALKALDPELDLIISDIRMPGADGWTLLEAARDRCPRTPVILLTAFGDVDGAMEAIRKGAFDYLPKPYQIPELKASVGRALDQRRHLTVREPQERKPEARLSSIVGKSPVMLEVYKMVARIAPSDVTVLITGESGTGKELVARAIHAESSRRTGPFVAVNCGGLAEGLLESELFGHEKGAFTGAIQSRPGLFEQARQGTLFLDEIGAVSQKMQSQLLRALQEGEVRRVGGNTTIQVDVRVLSATNRDLEKAVDEGAFREDLFYRLNVVPIRLPSLRERPEDIPLLAEHFVAHAGRREVRISAAALDILCRHTWPGNVRELENTISRALALCRGGLIVPADLPPALVGVGSGDPPAPGQDIIADRPTLDELTRRYAQLILDEETGNKSRAAQRLGIDRKTLYRLLSEEG